MQIYVKEWPNRAATLYTDTGEELWTFPSIESAMAMCAGCAAPLGERLDPVEAGMLSIMMSRQAVV
jgi:hypothetical protein